MNSIFFVYYFFTRTKQANAHKGITMRNNSLPWVISSIHTGEQALKHRNTWIFNPCNILSMRFPENFEYAS